jgi:hypothetical protein
MQHATGESDKQVEKLVKQFESLSVQATNHQAYSSAISTATLKLNDEYHYLTEAVFLQIQALEKEGKQIEASALATETFSKVTKTRAEEIIGNLGYVAQAWNSVKASIEGAIGAVNAIGARKTEAGEVARLQKEAADYIKINQGGYGYRDVTQSEHYLGIMKELNAAQEALNNVNDVAAQQSEKARVSAAAEHASAEQALIDKTRLKRSEGERQSQLDSFHERIAKWKDDAALNGTVNPNLNNDYITEETLKIIKDTEVHTAHAKAVKVTQDVYASFMEELAKYDAKTQDMAVNEGKQTDVQKYQTAELYKFVDAYKAGKMSLDEFLSAETALQSSLDGRSAIENAAQQAKDAAIATQAYDDALKSLQSTGAKEEQSLTKAIDAQRLHNEEIGKTKEQVEQVKAAEQDRITALLEGDAQVLDSAIQVAAAQAGFDTQTLTLWDEKLKSLREQIALRQQLSGELVRGSALEANAAATKKSFEEWKKGWDETDKIARQVFTDWGMQGTNMAKQIGDTLKKALLSAIYEATIKPIAFSIYSSAAGALGMNSGGASGMLSAASGANSLYGLATGGYASALGSGVGSLFGTTAGNAAMGTALLGDAGAASAAASAAGAAGGVTGAAGAAGMGANIASAMPYIAAAVIGYELLTGNKTKSSSDSGRARIDYTSAGVGGDAYSLTGDAAQQAIMVNSTTALAKSYFDTAKVLGVKAIAGAFEVGSNTGKQGENPNTVIGANFGKGSYSSGEISSADQAGLSLATSRALMTALQASELPKYLSGVFDGITASSATQQQITDSLNAATALKQFNDALMLMPAHFEQLATLSYKATQGLIAASGGMDKLQANLGTYYTNFYSAEEQRQQTIKNINAATAGSGLDAATATRDSFRAIVESQNLTTASGQKMYAALLGVSGEFASIVPAAKDASIAITDVTKALKDAQTASLKSNLDSATTAASDAYDALSRAVDAQRAADTAKYEADKAIATAAYTSQQTLMQASIDSTNASLDAVTQSVSKLKSLSQSLKSTLDGMRITGSDIAYRADAQAQISAALATARSGGGLPMDGQLTTALATVSKPSEQLFGTFQEYARDFYKTANDISSLSKLTGTQLTADEITQGILKAQSNTLTAQQKLLKDGFANQVSVLDAILTNAKRQLDAANGLNVSVLSVADALKSFNSAIQALAAERTAQSLPTTAVADTAGGSKAADYMTANPDVKAAYAQNTYGLDATQYANVHYALYGQSEGRTSPVADTKAKSYFELYPDVAAAFAVNTYGLSQVEFSATHFAKFGKAEGRTFPGFAVGTNYVPQDMTARIHEGEAIIPKAYNPAAGGQNNDALVAEIRALRTEVASLKASNETTAKATSKFAKQFETASEGGRAILTEVYA